MAVQTLGRPRDAAIDEAALRVTWELLQTCDYPRLTMAAVAAGAGVHKPSLYRRWPTKARLVVDALAHHLPADGFPDTGSLAGDLRAGVASLVAFWQTPLALNLQGLRLDLATDPDAHEAYRADVLRGRAGGLLATIDRAVERGELADQRDRITLLPSLLEGPVMHRVSIVGRPLDQEFVDAVVAGALAFLGCAT